MDERDLGSSPIIRTKKRKELAEKAIFNRMAFFDELYPKLYLNESGFIGVYRLVFLDVCFVFCCCAQVFNCCAACLMS